MKLVVGLGNFGEKYENTLHNMGFMAADCLSDRLGLKLKERECSSLLGVTQYNGEKLVIAKPLTYMNLSGVAVKELMAKYKAELSDLIVVFDDIDIERGTIRVRLEGSGGTHNGMRNIIETIGSKTFARVRVGIGKQPANMPLADYVLMSVPKNEREDLGVTIQLAVDEIIKLLDGAKR